MEQETDLNEVEKRIDALLGKAGFYLQTYRSIDALNILREARRILDGSDVRNQVRAVLYRDFGRAYVQSGNLGEGLKSFIQSYEAFEDNNDKASAAGMIAGYYLRDGKVREADEYAEKALQLATAPELLSAPYQIKGGIAIVEEDYPRAIELMTKAAEYAERSHCITDLAMIIMDLSVIFMKMGMQETALSEVYRAERYVKECHNLDLYLRCAIRRAKILFIMGKDSEAKELIMALDEQQA